METKSLVIILNVFYMFQKPILSEKPDSAFRWDSKGKKDEYEHRQLQVIQEFVVRFTHAYYNIVLLHILKTTRLCLTCFASTYSLTCCLE